MPLLYEVVYRKRRRRRFQEQETIRYKIPWTSSIGCDGEIKTLKLSLPFNKTKVLTANLEVTGQICVFNATPITPVSMEADFYVNGELAASRGIGPAYAPVCNPVNIATNIMGRIFEGWNEFKIEVRQSWSIFGCVSGLRNLSAFLELVYTGPPPPPPEEPTPEYLTYLKWGLVGVGAVTFVAVVVPKLLERRKAGG